MKNPFKPKHIGAHKMRRWHLIPRNRLVNVYLHKHVASDDDRALHDHPWPSVSFRLWGGKLCEVIQPDKTLIEFIQESRNESHEEILRKYVEYRDVPRICFRSATFAHRLIVSDKPVWTLFITGRYVREWGFHLPKGWVPWWVMTKPDGTPIPAYDERGAPVWCQQCGGQEFDEIIKAVAGGHVSEMGIVCRKCGHNATYWAHGHFETEPEF